jgi:hypothetical protein
MTPAEQADEILDNISDTFQALWVAKKFQKVDREDLKEWWDEVIREIKNKL